MGQCVSVMCILFAFAGAWEWEYLEEAIAEKLKNPLAVAQLMDRIRSFVGREKVSLSKTVELNCAKLFLMICMADLISQYSSPQTVHCSVDSFWLQASRDAPTTRSQQGPLTLGSLFNSPLYSDVIFMVQGKSQC